MAFSGVFTALYAIGVVLLEPISYGIIQCRLADSLITLSLVFGSPVIIGVTLGCLIANIYGGLGIMDIFFGAIANLIASFIAYKLRRIPILACISSTIIVTIIVGGYLWILFNVPWQISIVGVFFGSFISILILGYSLIKILKKTRILKGYGLIVE